MRLFPVLIAAALASGCATQRALPPPPTAGLILPMEAVRGANDNPRRGISGTFLVTVKAIAVTPKGIYINTEQDYRHQLNLTVNIAPHLQADVERQLGLPLAQLVNRHLLVTGTARRERIVFLAGNVPSDKYYFQTHVALYLPENITLAP